MNTEIRIHSMDKPTGKERQPGQRALDASGDGYWELNLLDGSAWFSDWFYRQLDGAAETKLTSWASLRELMPAETWSTMLRIMRNHLETRAPLDLEVRINTGSPDPRWWRIRGQAERDETNQPRYLSGIARDISEERRTHGALLAVLARLHRGFDALPIAAALLDANGKIVQLNKRWRELGAARATPGAALEIGGDYFDAWTTALPEVSVDVLEGLHALLRGERESLRFSYAGRCDPGRCPGQLLALRIDCDGVREIAIVDEHRREPTAT
jgi:PAS domain-containing protein